MRFRHDAAQRIGQEAEPHGNARELRKADEAERLCARMAFRCEDRRDEHGFRTGLCRAADRRLAVAGGGERHAVMPPQARDHIRTASRAAQFALGKVNAHRTGPRGQRGMSCNEEKNLLSPGERCQMAQAFGACITVIGAPDQRRTARQGAKGRLHIRQAFGIGHRNQRDPCPSARKPSRGAHHLHVLPFRLSLAAADTSFSPITQGETMTGEARDTSPGAAAERLADIRSRIARAAREAGRDPQDVTLIAVSKTFGEEAILPLIEAGQRVFGENRVQEAAAKWPVLRARFADAELHLIGPLQTNKLDDALKLFDVFHTLDREKLALALVKAREKGKVLPRLFVQVNTGEEEQKAGIAPHDADRFIARCREEWQLDIEGLMCIPPVDEEPALHFALIDKIARRNGLAKLSMGMSGDFETAVRLGATHVRVGSALFGTRA